MIEKTVLRRIAAAAIAAAILGGAHIGAARTAEISGLGDEAVKLLQQYVRVDTVNPPGNEARAADFFARIFDAEGIPYSRVESAPGRANIWARLKGGAAPALLLLNHTDVVPADASQWSVDPLSGVIRDGYIYGRGALDMKSGGILELLAFLTLHRSGQVLNRDVVFLATADEEAGGLFGAGWLVKNRPQLFRHVAFALNEGGVGTRIRGREVFTVEVTQKIPLWLRLSVTDEPSHGSQPHVTSSVVRLIEALYRIRSQAFGARMVPAVDRYFKALAALETGARRADFANMDKAIRRPGFLEDLHKTSPFYYALTRDTCAITRLAGSNKINVVPSTATAELDCRLLPDRTPENFIRALRSRLADPGIKIRRLMAFSPAISTTDTALYRAIESVISQRRPGAVVVPGVTTGFTDSHFLRDLGIPAYGFMPLVLGADERRGIHGNNERISVDGLKRAADLFYQVVARVAHE